ncbi:MAG: hypothetical protein QM433_10095 [Euryarchaeota archaeon]|nr:MAG: Uncharacterized protein XE07_0371 [Methanothrix harundinacea]MCP1392172.1 hypothetical protein [Methanothrix harundinacea]MDD3710132.1 hypothetical protein [Methanothrix sp.]MDI9399880.1 hypothetical protein [Euryarchaeota archaeon]
MTSSEDQEWAAASIDPSSLEEAKGAIVAGCRLFLERLDRLEGGLVRVRTAEDVNRFSRALSMYLLASLPLKSETCPFCIQHSGGNRCQGCGYAKTHGGRCDADASAFGQLIEAVYKLAEDLHKIRDDTSVFGINLDMGRERLKASIGGSREAAEMLMVAIPEAAVSELMEAKRGYIEAVLKALPADLIGSLEVEMSLEEVLAKLEGYW